MRKEPKARCHNVRDSTIVAVGTGVSFVPVPRLPRFGRHAMNDSEASSATDRAIEEGRVHGKYRCPRCGMRSKLKKEAADCCKGLGPPAVDKVSESRFERYEKAKPHSRPRHHSQ